MRVCVSQEQIRFVSVLGWKILMHAYGLLDMCPFKGKLE